MTIIVYAHVYQDVLKVLKKVTEHYTGLYEIFLYNPLGFITWSNCRQFSVNLQKNLAFSFLIISILPMI